MLTRAVTDDTFLLLAREKAYALETNKSCSHVCCETEWHLIYFPFLVLSHSLSFSLCKRHLVSSNRLIYFLIWIQNDYMRNIIASNIIIISYGIYEDNKMADDEIFF